MKILQINVVCGYGSTGRIATDLYKVLEDNGHEGMIAYGRGTSPEEINSYKIGTNKDMYSHIAATRVFDIHGFASKKATEELICKIEEYNPDIIHLHNIHGYYINIEVLFEYLKRVNKPIVWTLHDCWAFTGHCAHFDYIGCEKWKTQCNKCSQKKEYPSSIVFDNSKENYKKKKKYFTSLNKVIIVTPSHWLENLVKQSYLGKYEIKVINNGIDLEKFKPTQNDFKKKFSIENKFMILGVASIWEDKKGFSDFKKLASRLDNSIKIVMVGVNEKIRKELPENIIAIERTNNIHELAQIYTAADVFVNPTYEDTFPTTNLEALACGTPVITYKTGGSIESVNNECGRVVARGSIDGLVKAIEELKEKNLSAENCIEEGKKYEKTDRYNEYIDLYLELNRK